MDPDADPGGPKNMDPTDSDLQLWKKQIFFFNIGVFSQARVLGERV